MKNALLLLVLFPLVAFAMEGGKRINFEREDLESKISMKSKKTSCTSDPLKELFDLCKQIDVDLANNLQKTKEKGVLISQARDLKRENLKGFEEKHSLSHADKHRILRWIGAREMKTMRWAYERDFSPEKLHEAFGLVELGEETSFFEQPKNVNFCYNFSKNSEFILRTETTKDGCNVCMYDLENKQKRYKIIKSLLWSTQIKGFTGKIIAGDVLSEPKLLIAEDELERVGRYRAILIEQGNKIKKNESILYVGLGESNIWPSPIGSCRFAGNGNEIFLSARDGKKYRVDLAQKKLRTNVVEV